VTSARRVEGRVAPRVPSAWYFACASSELARGAAVSRLAGATPVVVFRTERGEVAALDAHCGHLGVRLALGEVRGDRIRCPLHYREYDAAGACFARGAWDGERDIAAFPAVERFGAVFVFNGPRALFPPPAFDAHDAGAVAAAVGRRVTIAAPWSAVAANAFDLAHLGIVHRRALREPAEVERVSDHAFRMRYRARVAGAGAADRVVRALSNDEIRATITSWGGPTLLVESEIGRHRAALALCLAPTDGGVEIVPLFCVAASSRVRALDVARVRIARWLYTSFLTRDVAILDGSRFRPRLASPDDDCLAAFLRFVGGLADAEDVG
jgi:nitrite reductase/ring-hydroxylating ferredoxin subunit